MRQVRTTLLLSAIMFFVIFSCDNENSEPIRERKTIDLNQSFPNSTYRIMDNVCNNTQMFELWDYYKEYHYGTVYIFTDPQYLYIQYDLFEETINEGWRIDMSWLFVGLESEWKYGDGYPDWYDGNFNPENHPELPTTLVRRVLLEDWMVEDCFIIASKVRLTLNGMEKIAIANINYMGEKSYLWSQTFCLEICDGPGTGTPGYWKNHPSAWPGGVTIGGKDYTINEAIAIMKRKGVKGDKTYNMFEQLVAAKLNVTTGNTSFCITDTIDEADLWMQNVGGVGSKVSAESSAWDEGGLFHEQLDEYNNGYLCASHRD